MVGRPVDDAVWDAIEQLTEFAAQRGHSLLELAFAGLLARPSVPSVIAGATRVEQVSANVAAGEWELTDDDVTALDELLASLPPAA